MPNEFEELLRKDLSHIPTYKDQAKRVDKELAKLIVRRNKISEQLSIIESNPQDVSGGDALEKTIAEAPRILWEQIKLAAKINTEFNVPFFTERLKQVAFDDKTITIILFKNGNIKVKFNLDDVAGSLSDYGNGIKRLRKELKTHSKAKIASWFWQEKFYGAGREGRPANVKRKGKIRNDAVNFHWKYWTSMQKRLDYSGKIAPFWQILDKGTMPIPNAHRKGGEGEAYPFNAATDFTTKAQIAIKEFYKSQSVQVAANSGFDVISAEKILAELEMKMEILSSMLEKLNTLSFDVGANLVLQMGDGIKKADSLKVQKLEQDLNTAVKILGHRRRLGGGERRRTKRLENLIAMSRP